MATHVLPLDLEQQLAQFADERNQSPDQALSAVLADFFAEYQADRIAGQTAVQRWQEYEAGNEQVFTLQELMEEDALGA